jgi:hypothetical protein
MKGWHDFFFSLFITSPNETIWARCTAMEFGCESDRVGIGCRVGQQSTDSSFFEISLSVTSFMTGQSIADGNCASVVSVTVYGP